MWGDYAQNLITRLRGQRILHPKHQHAYAVQHAFSVKRVNSSRDSELNIITRPYWSQPTTRSSQSGWIWQNIVTFA